MKKFWMVYVEGEHTPTHKHPTKASAREEATRLCQKEGRPAFVLEATEMCVPALPQWSILEELDENYPAPHINTTYPTVVWAGKVGTEQV